MKMASRKFDVTCIGNAIVDIFANVDEDLLRRFGIRKGETSHINEVEAGKLTGAIEVISEISGGSAANTAAALASLGNPVAFIGKVKDDRLGKFFTHGLINSGVNCYVKQSADGESTAYSIVLITPDAQRTMNTNLGIAGTLSPEDIDESVIADSKLVYLEGYLWDRPEAKDAFLKAVKIAHSADGKTALSLSDSFCVDRHGSGFLDLITNHIDILFANEDEIKSLFKTSSINPAITSCKALGITAAVTMGEKGSIVFDRHDSHTVEITPAKKLVDTTGAGDLYAAGFLHGYVSGRDLATCGRMGSITAAEVVSHVGARPECSLSELLKQAKL